MGNLGRYSLKIPPPHTWKQAYHLVVTFIFFMSNIFFEMQNMLDGLVSFIYGCIAQEMGIILKHEGIMIWVGKQLIIF